MLDDILAIPGNRNIFIGVAIMDYHDYKWHIYSRKFFEDTQTRVICWECYEMPNMIIMSVKNDLHKKYYFRVLCRDADNTLHDISGKLKYIYLAKWQAWKYYNEEGITVI